MKGKNKEEKDRIEVNYFRLSSSLNDVFKLFSI